MAISRRTLTAALTAPPVGISVTFVLHFLFLISGTEDFDVASFLFFWSLFLLIGTPISYLIGAAIGIPAYRLLQRRDRLTLSYAILVGALAGIVSYLPISFDSYRRPMEFAGLVFISVIGGACAGAWFWTLGIRQTSGP
jgi:hypothetical protein